MGLSRLAESTGIPDRQLTGHWCSRCAGIWFGYLLEVECPRCGSRDGCAPISALATGAAN